MPDKQYSSIELIKKLVSFDTTSRASNLALIDFVVDYLSTLGIDSHLIHDESGEKANLYATIGPRDVPGIVLSGHTDVVPVDGQAWDSDPFEVVEKENRLFGRGTSDMKSFIAIALAMAPKFANTKLKTPIHFALSFDEEEHGDHQCSSIPSAVFQLFPEHCQKTIHRAIPSSVPINFTKAFSRLSSPACWQSCSGVPSATTLPAAIM